MDAERRRAMQTLNVTMPYATERIAALPDDERYWLGEAIYWLERTRKTLYGGVINVSLHQHYVHAVAMQQSISAARRNHQPLVLYTCARCGKTFCAQEFRSIEEVYCIAYDEALPTRLHERTWLKERPEDVL